MIFSTILIGWYFCCSTSRQLFFCVKTFGSTSEKIIFQLTNNLEKKKVPYFRCELKHISSFPAGNPTKALALGLSTHHARAIVIMSPQGLRWSPYLIRNVISFWNTNDIESSKMLLFFVEIQYALTWKHIYLPNPLCSRDEKDTIASNWGATFERTRSEKSVGEMVVIFGWSHGYGLYSSVVICLAPSARSITSIHGRVEPITKKLLSFAGIYFLIKFCIRAITSLP